MALLTHDAKASTPTFRGWGGMETELIGRTVTSEGPWSMGAFEETDRSQALFFEPTHTSMRSPLTGVSDSTLMGTGHFISEEHSSLKEQARNNTVASSPDSQLSKGGRRISTPAVIGAILLSFACLGLLTSSTLAVSRVPNLEMFLPRLKKGQQEQQVHQQGQQEQQAPEEEEEEEEDEEQQTEQDGLYDREAEERLLLQRLSDVQQLDSLVTLLSESLGTGNEHASAAIQDVYMCLKRAKQVQQKVLEGSLDPSESPESIMQGALDSTMFAVYRLCGVARKQALALAQQTKSVQPPPTFTFLELEALGHVNLEVTDSLVYHMGSLSYSYQASMRQAAKAQADLKALPGFTGVESGVLLAAVTADADILKGALEAAQTGRRSTVHLATCATNLMLSHAVREQMCIYRECRDLLDEQKALSSAERKRQKSLPEENRDVIETLDKVDDKLQRGEQLLKKHYEEIEQLRGKKDIATAHAASQQAREVGEEVRALLELAASHMNSIPGIAGATEAAESAEVQHVMETLASRASKEATAAARAATDILDEMHLQVFPQQPLTHPMQYHTDFMNNRLTSPSLLKNLEHSLRVVKGKVILARNRAQNAAARPKRDSSASSKCMKEFAEDARHAAMEAEALLGEAELLRFQSQLIESLELDVQLSLSVSRRAAALLERSQQQQLWDSEMDSSRKRQIEHLLSQVNALEGAVRLQQDLKGLASAAAALKGAVMQLAAMIQSNQQDRPGSLL